MKINQILDNIKRIRHWAETGDKSNLPAAAELVAICNEIISMIEKDIDDLR